MKQKILMTFLLKKKAYVENILVGKNYFEHKRFLKEKKFHGFYFQKKKFGFQKSHDFGEKEKRNYIVDLLNLPCEHN